MVNLDKKILKTLFNSRDSATFCELEKLMGDSDKQLLNEDDTFSFEAMECRYDDSPSVCECLFCCFHKSLPYHALYFLLGQAIFSFKQLYS